MISYRAHDWYWIVEVNAGNSSLNVTNTASGTSSSWAVACNPSDYIKCGRMQRTHGQIGKAL